MDKIAKFSSVLILAVMFILIFSSALNDSATMDELAHIPSGYAYMALKDYRLNPEHPPLIKDLSAAPLLFMNLNYPTDVKAWTTDINGQWDMGRIFLYESGNNADKIIRWARLPIMLLGILFGWLLFLWVRGIYGNKVALLTLFLFAFSPTILAHSRYVTTDLGAAFGFFIGIAAFINFLRRQNSPRSKKYLVIAGVAFGIAQLLKFSLVLLAPLYLIFGFLWIFLNSLENFRWKKFLKDEFLMLGKIIIIGLIGVAVIWPVYIFHVWNYPQARQTADTAVILGSFGIRPLADLCVWFSHLPVLRAFGHYVLGVLMVLQRSAGGNDTYFMGQVTAAGWKSYFPLLYILKEQLPFLFLALIAIVFGIFNMAKSRQKNIKSALGWLKENFVLTASFIFVVIYWTQAISSNLNIGLRHILPAFPFIYLLVSRQIARWVNFNRFKRGAIAGALLVLMAVSVFVTFPYFLSYFNALAGGTWNGYKVAVDSNYDWGQDLKRLKNWTEENNVSKLYIAYFGGGNPKYYFGDKVQEWWSSYGAPPKGSYYAVSATFLQGATAQPVKGFVQKPEDTYPWLKGKEPAARAGTSIFIYKF